MTCYHAIKEHCVYICSAGNTSVWNSWPVKKYREKITELFLIEMIKNLCIECSEVSKKWCNENDNDCIENYIL